MVFRHGVCAELAHANIMPPTASVDNKGTVAARRRLDGIVDAGHPHLGAALIFSEGVAPAVCVTEL